MLKKIGQILNQSYGKTHPPRKFNKKVDSKKSSKGSAQQGNFMDLLLNWDKIAGEKLREVTLPQRIRNKVLTIVVSHPLYAQHLSLIELDIINKIETTFPKFKGTITNLKFYYSEVAFMESEQKFQQSLKYSGHKKVEYQFNKNDPQLKEKICKAKEIFAELDDDIQEIMLSIYLQS